LEVIMGGRLGELLVILAIVIMLFGTKRLKDFGGDLGAAIKGFRKNVRGDEAATAQKSLEENEGEVIEGKAEPVKQPEQQTKQ
jgi:sec-independent protein translocase protein TatA